jgi:hypothetical protein
MASCPPALSAAFRRAAQAEREKLLDLYEAAMAEREELAERYQRAQERAMTLARAIGDLGEILGIEDQLSIHELTPELRGQRLREVATAVLVRHFKQGDVVHYRQWLELVVDEGHRIGGKNAPATFLTQIAQIPEVRRVGRRSGLYEVVSVEAA